MPRDFCCFGDRNVRVDRTLVHEGRERTIAVEVRREPDLTADRAMQMAGWILDEMERDLICGPLGAFRGYGDIAQ